MRIAIFCLGSFLGSSAFILFLSTSIPDAVSSNPTWGICKKINRSHTHTLTENNTPDNDTHTHAHNENNTPNEHLPQTLNNVRRCRDDGAYHLQPY